MHRIERSGNWMAETRSRLALRRTEKPDTKAGQIRALWPEIRLALESGQSMKSIRKWLQDDAGITLGITTFTSYVSRIRRCDIATRHRETPSGQAVRPQTDSVLATSASRPPLVTPTVRSAAPKPPDDPLAQAMRVLSKPKMDIRKIHNDGDPEGRNLI